MKVDWNLARVLALAWAAMTLGVVGCGKDGKAAMHGADLAASTAAAAAPGTCPHASCGDNFFIDAAPQAPCAADAVCTVTLRLVALGDFHINEEYPYRFHAEDTPGVAFLGSDGSGKNVFSKAAGDWRKVDAKTGAMTITFKAGSKGSKAVAGTLKLSVCSAQNCLLDQRRVSAAVDAS
jgi:hypothetical protein